MLGLAAATLGMGTIALAPNLPLLSLGVVLAMSSTGFSWTPFNNAVHRLVPGIVASAGLQGLYLMMTSAVLAFWSERLFPDLPAVSFTAALLAVAAGAWSAPPWPGS